MVRARGPQSTLESIRRQNPDAHALIMQRAPADVLALIERSVPTAWIPVENDLDIFVAAWTRWFTEAETRAYCEGAVDEMLISPMLRPLVAFALRTLGSTPRSLLKVFPRGWGQVYRDCCRIEIEHGQEDGGRIHFVEMHPIFASGFHAYHYPIEAIVRGMCKLVNYSCTVHFEDQIPAFRSILHISWAKKD